MSIEDDVKAILDSSVKDVSNKQNPQDQSESSLSNKSFVPKNSPFSEPKKEYTPNPYLKTLRSFQGDMQDAIGKNKESVVSIATAEQKARQREREEMEKFQKQYVSPKTNIEAPPKIENLSKNIISTNPVVSPPVPQIKTSPKDVFTKSQNVFSQSGSSILKSGLSLALGLILFLGGILTIGVFYMMRGEGNKKVEVSSDKSIMAFTSKTNVSTSGKNREAILQEVSSLKNSFKEPVNSILDIRLTSSNTDQNQNFSILNLMSIIAFNAPESLKRSFKDEYMLGAISFDTNENFIILKPDDYGLVYSGMLRWENTMANDLKILFPDASLAEGVFIDDVYKNKDVRVLRDNKDKIVLIYGFLDRNTLLITANDKVWSVLVSKYINSQIVK